MLGRTFRQPSMETCRGSNPPGRRAESAHPPRRGWAQVRDYEEKRKRRGDRQERRARKLGYNLSVLSEVKKKKKNRKKKRVKEEKTAKMK